MSVNKPWEDMRRCVLNSNGTVNYYLDPMNSQLKADGVTPSVLDGTDGNVMVEIPKFYYKYDRVGSVNTWRLRTLPFGGASVHPAFVKAGVEVAYRYVGAYDACYLDDTDSVYKSGLNLDDMTSNLDLSNDVLASVSGVYPLVGITRDEGRTLAENNGTGWHQLDFALWSAIQMLFLAEYGSFNSQDKLGVGCTNETYVSSSSVQSDSPHVRSGLSNGLFASGSSDGSQPTSGGGTLLLANGVDKLLLVDGSSFVALSLSAYMSYRGIENIFGNCWSWLDGININQGTAGKVHYTNDYEDFADNTTTNYTEIATALPTTSGFQADILSGVGFGFLSSSNSGGSSSTFLTDQHIASSSLGRVVYAGGGADSGGNAGLFCLASDLAPSASSRKIGARLVF